MAWPPACLPDGGEILAVERKINALAPERGSLVARGRVLRAGRTLAAMRLEEAAGATVCATCQQTLIRLDPRGRPPLHHSFAARKPGPFPVSGRP